MTAFLQFQNDSKTGGDNATFLVYSADATLNLDNMEVTHIVTTSNRKDYLGRTMAGDSLVHFSAKRKPYSH
jgi:hypothetical protein